MVRSPKTVKKSLGSVSLSEFCTCLCREEDISDSLLGAADKKKGLGTSGA